MTWVKICGITNLEDALTAVEAGADALGFVFYEASPRQVTPRTVREMVARLPNEIEKVGVFVDGALEQMEETARESGLTAIQIHVSAPTSGRRDSASRTIKTFVSLRAGDFLDEQFMRRDWIEGAKGAVEAILLDSGFGKTPGGTGRTFDWIEAGPVVRGLQKLFRIVVAGGLNPGNVAEAMHILRPWGVDVSSGVEARPGKKDPDKVKAFVTAVREADKVH